MKNINSLVEDTQNEGLETFLVVRSTPFGQGHLIQTYSSKSLSKNRWGEQLNRLLEEIELGTPVLSPKLLILYYDPERGIQLFDSQIC